MPVSHLVNPFKLAEQNTSLAQTLLLADLPDNPIEAKFVFFKTEYGANVKFSAQIKLKVDCQRCLQPMNITFKINTACLIVNSEEELRKIPDELDAVIAEQGMLSLTKLLSEEIILSTPQIPMHKLDECPASAYIIDNSAND